eukprot:CAMPEP_0181180678 /NCGR_PEP_ID=MMETSP1096-20121128/6929_1 /TAXON_ID=156174 ORGANISM="Chrysochromulina ericina, Strain CCMP281" /NCGR_SAMPLE_ID=MMETSP1096 /ASSEMBLY_ACC=CAM_ASM_000453 /LENGTH=158 /DNA_ID=CAMNT_0023269125 /DNA_START=276 /DNA_END=752 /DNA_ORIENTATION=+
MKPLAYARSRSSSGELITRASVMSTSSGSPDVPSARSCTSEVATPAPSICTRVAARPSTARACTDGLSSATRSIGATTSGESTSTVRLAPGSVHEASTVSTPGTAFVASRSKTRRSFCTETSAVPAQLTFTATRDGRCGDPAASAANTAPLEPLPTSS